MVMDDRSRSPLIGRIHSYRVWFFSANFGVQIIWSVAPVHRLAVHIHRVDSVVASEVWPAVGQMAIRSVSNEEPHSGFDSGL